jgi:hypothetical protein
MVVHRRGVEAYDPVSGEQLPISLQVKDRDYIMRAGRCERSSREDVLVLAKASGTFVLRHSFSLGFIEEFGSEEHKYITALIIPISDLIFTGFLSGELRIFEFGNSQPKFRVQASAQRAAIRSLNYSKQHKLVFIGLDNAYEGPEETYIRLVHNPVLVYSMSAIATQSSPQPLRTLDGIESASCSALVIDDANNIAVAAASSGEVTIWDFVQATQLMKITPSSVVDTPVMLRTLGVVGINRTKLCLIIGFNDGSILCSELIHLKAGLTWVPSKLVRPKTSSIDSNLGVTFIQHDSDLDILMIGTDLAQLRLLNNFKSEQTPQVPIPTPSSLVQVAEVKSPHEMQAKVVSQEALQKVRDRIEGRKVTAKTELQSGFSRFLTEKKPELLEMNPDLSMKEILMMVSTVWGELDEEERQRYD